MSEFVDFLSEVFEQFGDIQSRRMFGGHGIYHGGVMIGLVADDVLYLKADEESSSHFRELGLPQFEYEKNDKSMKMSYYLAPDEIFDDPQVAQVWAKRAYAAALRSKKPGSHSTNQKTNEKNQ